MGCSTSRVANEDTVRRCKDRRRLMKAAVLSRHQLAAAHSDYLRSLRRAAAALSLFASFQSLSVSDKTPPVLLQPPPPSSSSVAPAPPPPPPAPPFSPAPPPPPPKARSTRSGFSATASQTSSAWNWEEFYPPSPPGSDFYDRLSQQRREQQAAAAAATAASNGIHHLPIEEDEESELERRRKKWDDRYSATTASSSVSDGGAEEEEDDVSRSEYRPPSDLAHHASRMEIWRGEEEDRESAASMLMVLRHRDLKEIVTTIEEYFDKAAVGGEGVSDLLEVGRAQLDRSFRQLKKTLYHSSSVLSTLSSTWSSRPPLAVRYQMDAREVSEGGKNHCSTLDRLLAWEKKLYEEVKAREGAKIEHEKKLSILQSQEYKGADILKLDKTKTAIQRLQSLILVTSEAVSTTSSAIIKVRDDELAPQLIELCRGFLQMWRAMHQCHEVQHHIVQQVRGLVKNSITVETDDLHRQATRDLESAVTEWHSSFVRLVKFQRDYVRSLYSWLKLTLSQVSNELSDKDHYSSLISSELTSFCDEWKQAVDRLPDTVAAEAIHSFVNVVHSISLKQKEELKIKKRVEAYSKELEKKTLALRNIERKYYRSYSMVGVGFPDRGFDDNGQVFDARDPLIEKKTEIAACRRKVDDEMARHARAIWATREMTLNNIQTGLPGLFQAMAGFSGLFAEALEDVCCRRAGTRR